MRDSSAFLLFIDWAIGQIEISGSPSKYICVIRRCKKLNPNTEKIFSIELGIIGYSSMLIDLI